MKNDMKFKKKPILNSHALLLTGISAISIYAPQTAFASVDSVDSVLQAAVVSFIGMFLSTTAVMLLSTATVFLVGTMVFKRFTDKKKALLGRRDQKQGKIANKNKHLALADNYKEVESLKLAAKEKRSRERAEMARIEGLNSNGVTIKDNQEFTSAKIENMKTLDIHTGFGSHYMVRSPELKQAVNLKDDDYKFLEGHQAVREIYLKIATNADRISKSLLGARDKERAKILLDLANQILVSLKNLNDIGGLYTDLNSEKYNEQNPSPVMKARTKIQEIQEQMDSLINKEAEKIGSQIDDLTLPVMHDLQDEFEQLKSDGIALLALVKHKDTAVSEESEFVLRKVVETRLDEMWEEYTKSKSVYVTKEALGNLELSKGSREQSPDEIVEELFGIVRSMYAEIEESIKTSNEKSAISDLLATKDYFLKRGKTKSSAF